tara:strand:+ start:49 stop:534 length:486 start_codon:yes stop_codon:yes gene_type:complete
MQTWDQRYRQEIAEKDQEIESLQQQLMISGKGGSPGQPYDDPEKGKGPFVPPPPRDKLLAGPSSRQIRDKLKPFTHGTGYDGEGGSLRGVPDALRKILLKDAMAGGAPKNDLQIAGLNLGGGRFLHNYEIKMLRDHFTGASEKERNRLIEMYSDKPFRGLV